MQSSITLRVQTDFLLRLEQEIRMVRSALNDMEKTRFTAGEAEAIHGDLNRLQSEFVDLEVRVGVLEKLA